MEPKKISFGFMKTKKTEKPVVEEKKDYIECVEEKAIKVVGGESVEEVKPLVIPMKPNTLITAERLKEIAEKVENEITEEPKTQIKSEPHEEKPSENETLDQMAVRELLQDAKKEVKIETAEFAVPIPAKPVMDGEKESTLDDYESVPIQDFGMAMLRGMGWTPNKDGSKYKLPELRPKGLGLGADKVIKENQKKNASKGSQNKDEELAIIKNSFVKIVTGKYSGCYGKVVSLDEDNGRVMVDIPIKKQTVSLSEFMVQAVTKAEFDKESRVINQDTYEEYKKREGSQKSTSSRNESSNEPSSSHKPDDLNDNRRARKDKYKETEKENQLRDDKIDKPSNGQNRDRKTRDSSDEERIRTKRDSSEDQSNRRTEKKRSKERKTRDSSDEERVRNKRDSSDVQSSRKKEKRSSSSDSLHSLPDDKKKKHKSSARKTSEDRSSRRKEKRYSSNDSLESLPDEKKKKHKSSRRKTSDDRSSRRKEKRYSSSDSLDSLPDEKKKKHKSSKKKSSSDSDDYNKSRHRSKTPEGKRDIDKKRKGKKKRRDRDRSPNYKKHRK